MLKPDVLGMDYGISEGLRGIAGLPDGMASLMHYFERFGVTPEGQRLVLETFKAPSRNVGRGRFNTSKKIPSRKMRRGVQAESRTVEGRYVQKCEEDPDVLFFLCQPHPIHVRQTNSKGHVSRQPRTFDYLVFSINENSDGAGFWLVECKPAEKLEAEARKPYANYTWDGSRWRFLAAEAAAEELGLRFCIFSSDEIDTCWAMNMDFLSDFVAVPCPDDELAEALLGWLREAGSLRIQQALSLPGMRSEVVWWLIANNQVWADWSRELVSDSDTSSIHISQAKMLASRHLREPLAEVALSHKISAVRVEPGFPVQWDGESFIILHRGKKEVTLRYCDGEKRTVTLLLDEFSKLLHNGSIRGEENGIAARISEAREALVRRASDKALREAVERYRILREYRETGIVPAGLSRRSLERFERWAREGERQYGGEFFGLIRLRGRTPGTPELDSGYQAVLAEKVKEYRDDPGGADCSVFYREFRRKCKELGLYPIPSYSTLRRWLKKSRLWELLFDREGWHSAYRVMGPTRTLEDEPAVPARVFETAHLDHTPLSVKVVSTYTGKVLESRVNLTFLTDAYCGLPLAIYLSFDHPSKVAVCEVLHDCLARHARLPDSIVVDKGAEFGSVDWEKALVMLDVVKVQRPASSPRVGSPIERNFGITDSEFIHALPGSMRLAKPGRKQSPSHAPAKFAKLTFAQLQQGCEKWFFEVFPELAHGELGATRKEAFEHSLEHSGQRVSRHVRLDDGVRIALALSVSGDTRRVHPVRGIRVEWLDYWHDLFSYGDVAGTNVEVKVDPLDVSVVFARVRGEWVNCRISNGRAHLIGKSWKLVNLAIKELQEQRRTGAKRRWVNSEKVAELIKEVTGQDSPLARQAELDRESGRGADLESVAKGRPNLRLVKNKSAKSRWLDGATEVEANSVPNDDDGLAAAEPCDVI